MKQLKALLTKEIQTHRNTLLTPLWFTAGFYAVVLLGLIINLIKGDNFLAAINVRSVPQSTIDLIAWIANMTIVAMLGLVSIISALTLSDNILNGDYKKRCEILHLSQPVSLIKIMSIKYLVMIIGSLSVLLGLAVFNSLIVNSLLSNLIGANFGIGMTGMLQSYLDIILALLFTSSLFWVFGAIFKNKPFFMGLLVILSIEVTIRILNYMVGWEIPSLATYVLRLSSVSIRFNSKMTMAGAPAVADLIALKWQALGGIDNIMKVVYSAIAFVAGYFIYKRREVI